MYLRVRNAKYAKPYYFFVHVYRYSETNISFQFQHLEAVCIRNHKSMERFQNATIYQLKI